MLPGWLSHASLQRVTCLEGAGGRRGDGQAVGRQLVVALRQRLAAHLDGHQLHVLAPCSNDLV